MATEKIKFLTREEILAQRGKDIQEEIVHVPEWGGSLRVVGMTGDERDEFENLITVEKRNAKGRITREALKKGIRAALIAMVTRNPDGSRVFTVEDIKALGELSASAEQRVFEPGARLSGISNDDLEELGKVSEPTTGDDSPIA